MVARDAAYDPQAQGTERLQADIKARIKDLAEEFEGPKRVGAHGGPTHVIHPEGAAQIALIGPPNAGKSLLRYPTMTVSASTGRGLGELSPWLFRQLGIMRVYTKAPHRPPDRGPPFTLRRGQTCQATSKFDTESARFGH
jgi:ribosome-interacting GTPase 1